jgi:hypothetical protein
MYAIKSRLELQENLEASSPPIIRRNPFGLAAQEEENISVFRMH